MSAVSTVTVTMSYQENDTSEFVDPLNITVVEPTTLEILTKALPESLLRGVPGADQNRQDRQASPGQLVLLSKYAECTAIDRRQKSSRQQDWAF